MTWGAKAGQGRQRRNMRRKREHPDYRGYWEAMILRALEQTTSLELIEAFSEMKIEDRSGYFTARVHVHDVGEAFIQTNPKTRIGKRKINHCRKYGIPLLLVPAPHRMSTAGLRVYIERWAASLRTEKRRSQQ